MVKPEVYCFNGPILLTTNCLVPLKENAYLDRLFTTGVVGYEGAVHISDRPAGGSLPREGRNLELLFQPSFGATLSHIPKCPRPSPGSPSRHTVAFAAE